MSGPPGMLPGGSAGSSSASGGVSSSNSGGNASTSPGGAAGASAVAGQAGAPSAGGAAAGDDEFAHGARLVVPQQELTQLTFFPGTQRFEGQPPFSNVSTINLVDGPTYSRTYPVTIPFDSLVIAPCNLYAMGHLEVTSVDVEQDLDGQGATLSFVRAGDGYTLTHDGPGHHHVRVLGAFVPNRATDTGGGPAPACPVLDDNAGQLPVSLTYDVTIKQAAGATVALPASCGERALVLSGRSLDGPRVYLLDSGGKVFGANNAADPPLDVVVETESAAEIQAAAFGFSGKITVQGAPQRVRLSTGFGPLTTYDIADISQLDGWKLDFWYTAVDDIKSPRVPATDGSTYGPIGTQGRVGGDATISVAGRVPCSPFTPDDFSVTAGPKEVCTPSVGPSGLSAALPGSLAMLFGNGTCSLDVRLPAANGGQGLSQSLSLTFANTP